MKSNLQYWKARAKARVEDYTVDADKIAAELGKAYYAAERMLKEESRKVFKGFQNAFKLSKSEAKRLVDNTNVALPSKAVKSIIDGLSDNDLKNQLLAYLSAPAYQYRMKRLDNLAKSADKICKQLYTTELRTDTAYFATEIDKAYKHLIFDIQQGTGTYGAFNQIPQSRIQEILKYDWSGEHYSKRIWGNTQDLAETLKQNMIESFLTGESEQGAAARIQQRFKVGFNEARRLIRTDNTFITNQAELEGYNEAEIEEYTYMAVMDNDTSDECKALNGKSFKVKNAKPGVNLPPMHPWCRSTTIGKLPSEEELDAMWDKDMAEYVPEGLTFNEWLDGLQPTEDGKLVYTGKSGKSVDISGESGISETAKSAFVPAKNIKEAQEYAEKLGVKYADYSKFPLERANNMNMALSTLPDDSTPLMVTDLQKYSKVTGAPLGRAQKNGYAVTASPYEINPSAVGSSDAKLEGSGETIIAVNTRNFKTLDSLTESKREYNEKYENLKGCRWHFNMEGKMTDFHECGHVYEKKYGLPTGFIADAERWRKETKLGLLKSDREAWAEAYGAYYTHRDDLPDYIRKYFDEGEVKTVSGSKVLSFEEWQKKIGVSIDKTAKGGIIDIEIDEFVPCLKDSKTGEILATEVKTLAKSEYSKHSKSNGWNIDWKNIPDNEEVLGVYLKNDTEPQGLIAIRKDKGGVFVSHISTAPQNNKQMNNGTQKYIGVGGHLFAAAIEESVTAGNKTGCIFGYAANKEVLKHYIEKFGAIHLPIAHEFQFLIDGNAAQKIIETYNFERR